MKISTLFPGFFLVSFFVLLSCELFAQPCPPGCPQVLPIDGGIGLLLAAGIAYGTKKVFDSRGKQKN